MRDTPILVPEYSIYPTFLSPTITSIPKQGIEPAS